MSWSIRAALLGVVLVVARPDVFLGLDSEPRGARAAKTDDVQPEEAPLPADLGESRSEEERRELAELLVKRGRALQKKNQYEAALADLDVAAKLAPEMTVAHLEHAICLGRMRRYGEAAEALRLAIRSRPEEPGLHVGLGGMLFYSHDYAGAAESMTQAISLGQRDAETYGGRASARYFMRDHKGCIEDCDEAIRLEPRRGRPYAIRAAAQGKLGHYDQAIKDYDRAIELTGPPNLVLRFARMFAVADRAMRGHSTDQPDSDATDRPAPDANIPAKQEDQLDSGSPDRNGLDVEPALPASGDNTD